MTSERWQRIKQLFEEALEQDAGERFRFLAEACGEDGELRQEVQSLLEAQASDPDFIESPAEFPSDLVESVEDRGSSPRVVGPYRILQSLASGGMGDVFLAERADEAFQKQVAIKIAHAEWLDWDPERRVDAQRRFQIERQALAELDHPHIAKLLDGGTTAAGTPFLVMDYVKGRPIDLYFADTQLSMRERLRLFCSVCEAVDYAHRHLIVHRDLKPSNILVTEEGVPKLLDFGIAKLLDGEPLRGTMTRFQPMTPRYASPEQVRGERVATASDVYSLGVILYEFLTGRSPYPLLDAAAPHQVAKWVCEHEPEKPSAVVARGRLVPRRAVGTDGAADLTAPPGSQPTTADRLRRMLAGDLDMIALKALRKEPARRYASAEQLAVDIRCYLEGKPVTARPDTLTYRTSKFIGRHVAALLGSALVTLGLVTATGVTAWHAHVARRERAAAEQANAESQEVTGFLENMLASVVPDRALGREITVREVLDDSAREMEGRFESQPLLEARLQTSLGKTYGALGRYGDAEHHLRRALELRRRSLPADHADMADSLNYLGSVLNLAGRYAEAEPLFSQAMEIFRKEGPANQAKVAQVVNNLGQLRRNQGNDASAEVHYREALALRCQAPGEDSIDCAASLNNLASLLKERKNFAESEDHYRRALNIRKKRLPAEHPNIAQSLNNLAALLKARRKWDEAEELFRESLDLRLKLYDSNHPQLAVGLNNLALFYQDRGQFERAEPWLRQAVEIYRQCYFLPHKDLATALTNLGALLQDRGDWGVAEPIYQEALGTWKGIDTEDRHGEDVVLRRMVRLYDQLGKPEALRAVTEQLIGLRQWAADRAEADAGALNDYAWILLTCEPPDLRDPAAALPYVKKAVEMSKMRQPAILDTLALAQFLLGDVDAAIETERQALSLLSEGDSRVRNQLSTRLEEFQKAKATHQEPSVAQTGPP